MKLLLSTLKWQICSVYFIPADMWLTLCLVQQSKRMTALYLLLEHSCLSSSVWSKKKYMKNNLVTFSLHAFKRAVTQMIKGYAKHSAMDSVRYWLLGAMTFVCIESAMYGIFMINVCLHSVHAVCMMMSERSTSTLNSLLFARMQSVPVTAPGSRVSSPQTVTLLCASHDPGGWWLADLPASAILTDWSSVVLYSNQWL